jgi:hypothetical protein
VAKRERFFEFNWLYLLGLLFSVASAWVANGFLFVLVLSALAGVVISVYYVVWRWLQSRSE